MRAHAAPPRLGDSFLARGGRTAAGRRLSPGVSLHRGGPLRRIQHGRFRRAREPHRRGLHARSQPHAAGAGERARAHPLQSRIPQDHARRRAHRPAGAARLAAQRHRSGGEGAVAGCAGPGTPHVGLCRPAGAHHGLLYPRRRDHPLRHPGGQTRIRLGWRHPHRRARDAVHGRAAAAPPDADHHHPRARSPGARPATLRSGVEYRAPTPGG
jgi:hypothetical protein